MKTIEVCGCLGAYYLIATNNQGFSWKITGDDFRAKHWKTLKGAIQYASKKYHDFKLITTNGEVVAK